MVDIFFAYMVGRFVTGKPVPKPVVDFLKHRRDSLDVDSAIVFDLMLNSRFDAATSYLLINFFRGVNNNDNNR